MIMRRILGICATFVLVANLHAAPLAKTYQVTGPIVELTDKTIVVQKGDERWEIARDENTRNKGDLKVGDKVTICYRMTATGIESKGGPEPKRSTK
jgi:hypothetical protein